MIPKIYYKEKEMDVVAIGWVVLAYAIVGTISAIGMRHSGVSDRFGDDVVAFMIWPIVFLSVLGLIYGKLIKWAGR